MFGRKKEPVKERRPRPAGSLAQYGIFEIPENLGDLGGQIDHDDDDDEDLEAELAALTSGDQPRRAAPKRPPPKSAVNLDAMISESMRDINSDEELSGDDDDPDLLNELKTITGEVENDPADLPNHTNDAVNEITKLLEERLSMYKKAEKKAKIANEPSRARRYNRGVKTLEQLLHSCQQGHEIDSNEIPPILAASAIADDPAPKPTTEEKEDSSPQEPVKSSPETNNTRSEEEPPLISEPTTDEPATVTVDEETVNKLKNRQKEYKIAALAWKRAGNLEEAMKYIKITKQFDAVIIAVSQGNVVDLSDMPPPPSLPDCTVAPESSSGENKEENVNQQSADVKPNVPVNISQSSASANTLEGALKERLEIYRRSKTVAESEGNSSKVRRYGRICKQFEDALKLYAKGKAIPIDDLPTPPGFPPLSEIVSPAAAPSKPAPAPPTTSNSTETLEIPTPSTAALPATPAASITPVAPAASVEPETPDMSKPSTSKETTPVAPPRTNSDKKKKLTSRVDKQIEILQIRQKELKMAALKAKKDGDLDLAKDYLRQAKGIDPLLTASLAGLPVDLNSIPLSPEAKLQLENHDSETNKITDDGFAVISSMDCTEATGSDQEIFENLEAQLMKQIKWCLSTRDHCKALADVSNYNKWERLALDYKKDLDMIRTRKRNNLPPPQHHYEIKTYSIVQSCTDLTDADIEISIIRGVNYTKEVDTYVIFELPWPSDSASSDRTSTIRDNNNPEYNATFPLTGIIDRKSRQCLRVFKRHALKCQVWSKGGFFRADSLVGTANIKLQPLETQCILHDSFPLMDGRKAVGGKLEVKIRLRNPILTKQIEQNTDKWLAIDH